MYLSPYSHSHSRYSDKLNKSLSLSINWLFEPSWCTQDIILILKLLVRPNLGGKIALSISSVCWFFCASIGGSLLVRGGWGTGPAPAFPEPCCWLTFRERAYRQKESLLQQFIEANKVTSKPHFDIISSQFLLYLTSLASKKPCVTFLKSFRSKNNTILYYIQDSKTRNFKRNNLETNCSTCKWSAWRRHIWKISTYPWWFLVCVPAYKNWIVIFYQRSIRWNHSVCFPKWIFAADGGEDEKLAAKVLLPWKYYMNDDQQRKPGNY